MYMQSRLPNFWPQKGSNDSSQNSRASLNANERNESNDFEWTRVKSLSQMKNGETNTYKIYRDIEGDKTMQRIRQTVNS